MKKILILGGTTFDSIIHLNALPEQKPQTIHFADFIETIGSTGSGKSLNLTKLNLPNTLHSIIGEDIYGEKIIEKLRKEGVDFIYDLDAAGTERHINIMDKDGRRISIFVTQSSANPEINMTLLEKYICASDIIVLNIICYTKKLINLCKKYNKPIWTDIHDFDGNNSYHQDYIDAADYVFMSSDNLENYEYVMKTLCNKGKKLVVCTHGKRGASCLTEYGDWFESKIIEDYVHKDSNGAGDSFFSGFLYGYLKDLSIPKCMKLGTICAGLCITSKELVYEGLSEQTLIEEYNKYYFPDQLQL